MPTGRFGDMLQHFTAENGIEVKHSKSIRKKDLHGLKAFKEDYPEAKVVLLYMGDQQLLIDSILCVPCAAFLAALHKDKTPMFL